MLVNRYFGSKERLFGEVVAEIIIRPILLTGDTLRSAWGGGRRAAGLVATAAAGGPPLEGFQIMARSAGSPRAAEITRRAIEAGYQRPLASALHGAHAAERAGLLLAFVAGVHVLRQTIGLKALAAASPAVLTKLLEPVFQKLWAGEDPARTIRAG